MSAATIADFSAALAAARTLALARLVEIVRTSASEREARLAAAAILRARNQPPMPSPRRVAPRDATPDRSVPASLPRSHAATPTTRDVRTLSSILRDSLDQLTSGHSHPIRVDDDPVSTSRSRPGSGP